MSKSKAKNLPAEKQQELFKTLKTRFEKNMKRHKGLNWADVEARLGANPAKLTALYEMEASEGEPDVVGVDKQSGAVIFFDCSPESPKGRRSICYDREGWESRKEARPDNTAIDMANEMGVELLNEEEYRMLQELGEFDLKTSSWLLTPPEIRKLGGAIFGDRRYNTVFIYHNGAQSYYGARGFRASLRI